MVALTFVFVVGLGYLFGSICSAVVVSKLFSLPDPRTSGSKNPGATNVLRLSGKKYASIVLVADILKGLIPVLFARMIGADLMAVSFTCLAVVLGHMYPVFFGFRGGKGVATAIGALLGLHFLLGVLVIATWLLVANFTRYASLASIISVILAPFFMLVTVSRVDVFPPIFFIALFVLYKHRNNITRLIDGEEPKIQLHRNSFAAEINAVITEQAVEKQLAEDKKEANKKVDEESESKNR